jgi:hypothetical protein
MPVADDDGTSGVIGDQVFGVPPYSRYLSPLVVVSAMYTPSLPAIRPLNSSLLPTVRIGVQVVPPLHSSTTVLPAESAVSIR